MGHVKSKPCRVCGITKPIDQFYTHPRMADGHLNMCIPCAKDRALIYRAAKLEEKREYDRKRGSLPHRVEQRKRRHALLPEEKRTANAAWMRRNRKKVLAQKATRRAIKKGLITREPCATCGSERVHAHHEDYDQPLIVQWLCPACHAGLHAKKRERQRMEGAGHG